MRTDRTIDPYARAKADVGPVAVSACPSCGGVDTRSIYSVSNIPVQICVLLDTRQEALDFPCGDLDLAFCDTCGFIHNSKFDARLLDYASAAEESQHFSATFSRYAHQLARDIDRTCGLEGKTILEIGCGRGDFLLELVSEGNCSGIGIDPGFRPERLDSPAPKRLEFIADYFSAEYADIDCDIIICRHTLEHIGPVAAFMADVRATLGDRDNTCVLFETPDAGRVLKEGAFWDIYYEHCSYFTPGSQARLFRDQGFAVTELRLVYDDQYIVQFAQPASGALIPKCPAEEELEALRALVQAFPDRVSGSRKHWRNFVSTRRAEGRNIALWGGGSKCVSFITSLDIADDIATVVDVNPFKQGKFLPSVGAMIESPQALIANPPDVVIIMNPIYLKEIGSSLGDMGLSPEIVAV